MNARQIFQSHIAQTSQAPIGIEMVSAKGIYIWDLNGKQYMDGIAGFSVCNIGHSHPSVVAAVQAQAATYMHLIVYGEFIEQPQTNYAKLLTDHLPSSLNTVYFTNSGTEATEGAMKLAKRVTGRTRILCFHQSYHGSTQGALSLMGDEYWRNAYRPLLPDVYHYPYNDPSILEAINEQTACVILETVQAESGVKCPDKAWMQLIRERCTQTGTLLILDEIQAGFGRTGTLFAFEQMGILPDILLLGKALGGGMPLGAFIASKEYMHTLTHNPVLGHITTFGGHPVSCAAGYAALQVLLNENWMEAVPEKEALFLSLLKHKAIQKLRSKGLWMSLEFETPAIAQAIIHQCILNGLITDWFLFAPNCLRIAPPLSISFDEIRVLSSIILDSIRSVAGE